jgi:hypothetical protein
VKTNPLDARAMYLGNTEYRIHGTNQPSTIGTFRDCTAGSESGGVAIAAETLKDRCGNFDSDYAS